MKSVRVKDNILLANASPEVHQQLSIALGGVFRLQLESGEERIITVAEREQPKLIILEAGSLSNGTFGLCQRISQHKKLSSIPIIVVIEPKDVQNMAEGYYKGASDYMVKPLIPAEVLVRVGGQLELASATTALKDMRKKQSAFNKIRDNLAATSMGTRSTDTPYRILVVDDYPGNLNALVDALEPAYSISTATNGRDALELAEREYFDLILLDVVMPEMDGYEVCRQLKANEKTNDIPIIFLTGQMEAQDEIHGLELGAVDYIFKPYTLSVVLARVQNHLNAARYQKQLKCYSYQDGLTNIPNRRHFDELLNKEFKRAAREKKFISIILLDIDEFKLYNDHFGHVIGDDCLRKVGKALSNCEHRASDFVGRYGGEEFVALLPDTDENGALHMAQVMLDAVRDLTIPHSPNAQQQHVTVSIGAATCLASFEESPSELLDLADSLLYKAKRAGRNQIRNGSATPALTPRTAPGQRTSI